MDLRINLYHITPDYNRRRIAKEGLRVDLAIGKRRCIWLMLGDRIPWGMEHIAKWHKLDAGDLVVYKTRLPLSKLIRTGRSGIYLCYMDIPANLLKLV